MPESEHSAEGILGSMDDDAFDSVEDTAHRGSGVTRDGVYFPELRRALAGDPGALEALYRLESSLTPVVATVKRYGRVWAKDTDYYAAAEALGIKEPPGGVTSTRISAFLRRKMRLRRADRLARVLTERELAYLGRALFRQRIDRPDDEPTLVASLDPLVSVARMRSKSC